MRVVAPEAVHQPPLQDTGAKAQALRGGEIIPTRFVRCFATQFGDLFDDLLGFVIRSDRNAPSHVISANLSGEHQALIRSEEHTSELQSLMRISYAVFCLKQKKKEQKT